MKLSLRPRTEPEVNLTSLIDVVLLLLIFFMVASVVVTEKVDITLPESKSAKVPEDIKGRLVLAVDANDQIYIGMVPVTIDELKEIISKELDLDPNLRIMIRADARVPYKTSKELMIACGSVGATDLIYASFEE